jgi:signal transduction histidine kinase
VAVIAFEFGWRAGVAAALVATGWVVVWNQLELTALGYFARGSTYVFTALVVGLFADRLRAAQTTAVESERRVAELQIERQEQAAAGTAERARLAREVHDVIAHSVSVMTVQTSAARRTLERDPGRAAAALEAVEQIGRDALAEMRREIAVRGSRAQDREHAPQRGIDDLDALAEQMRGAGLEVEIRTEGERPRMAAAVDLSVYRIAQEALTNTLKHARASQAAVVVRYGDGCIELECTDDGAGPAGGRNGNTGHGLTGMRERAVMLGGAVQAGPRPEGGFRVHARLPLRLG